MKKALFLALFLVFIFNFTSYSFELTQYKVLKYGKYISKITFDEDYLIVGFENGTVDIRTFKDNSLIYTLKLPKIHDFTGDLMDMPIYSLDIYKNKLLILTQGENQSRVLFFFNLNNHKLKKVFATKLTLMKAKFLNENKIIFATLADEIVLYDVKTNSFTYKKQIGNYVFSTFALNGSKNLVAIGDESGVVKVFDVSKRKIIAKIDGINKDKTLALSFFGNLILNASVDKKIGIYNYKTLTLRAQIDTKFLPYAAILCENCAIYQVDEQNNIAVYSFNLASNTQILKGHTMPLIGMGLVKDTLISYSPAEIILWKIIEKE